MIRHGLKAGGRLFSHALKSMSSSTTAETAQGCVSSCAHECSLEGTLMVASINGGGTTRKEPPTDEELLASFLTYPHWSNPRVETHADRGTVEVEKVGKIVLIGINRPDKRNAVNPETAEQLHEAFKQFDDDKDSLVAILHGKGGSFCAGLDLGRVATSVEGYLRGDPQQSDIGPMGPSRLLTSKPIIAAVSGYAVAGGMELALMCDLRVMEESAIMGIFCRRFGVPLIDGGTVRLPKLIGLSRALDLILTGRPVGAKEALEMGLANRVVATGTALGQSLKLAQEIAKFPQQCMNVDRRSAYYSTFDAESWDAAMQYEFKNGMKVIQDEAVPGAASFVKGIGKHGSFNINKPSKL